MINSISEYINNLSEQEQEICNYLYKTINTCLNHSENKIWHSHPVWFIDKNPIVGFSKQKNGIRLMFWSGQSFEDEKLIIKGKKFKDASVFYNEISEINKADIENWLKKSETIQWDYKNIVKRKGVLLPLF